MSETKKPRRSVISRGLKRTLKTAEYESLVIEIGFEEEIEWSSLSERQKKVDNWNTVLLQEFKQSSDRILEELGITHKKAYFKNPTEATQKKYQAQAQASGDFDIEELDTLEG